MQLLVTRPASQAAEWVDQLAAAGVPAVALPLIGIEPVVAEGAVDELHAAWRALPALRFVMFVSGNAVQQFFAHRPAGVDWPAGLRAGATGPGTAQALRQAGLPDAAIVQPAAGGRWDAEALWARIGADAWRGAEVLVVRGERGRDWLAEQWRAAGARVRFLEAYRRTLPALDAAQHAVLGQAVAQPAAWCWLFSSSESVLNLQQLAPPGARWTDATALATHPRIAEAARQAGFGAVTVVQPELAAVAAAWHRLR